MRKERRTGIAALGGEIPDESLRWVTGGTPRGATRHIIMEDMVVKGDKPPTGGHAVS